MLRRLATRRTGPTRVRLRIRKRTAVITISESNQTPRQMHHRLNEQLKLWNDVHIHRNADDSLAVAYGNKPPRWPEDEE